MKISVYTDGSAQTAPNPGGWGSVILIDDQFHHELSGSIESATNNDAELIAAIQGLTYAQEIIFKRWKTVSAADIIGYQVILLSDSEIVLNWANGTYKFKQVAKLYLYEKLKDLMESMNVKTQWIRGHSGNQWNERCDVLANNARKGIIEERKTPKTITTRIGTKKEGTVSLWYQGKLKVIDFESGIVEDYDRESHGKRGSVIEIREGKER